MLAMKYEVRTLMLTYIFVDSGTECGKLCPQYNRVILLYIVFTIFSSHSQRQIQVG